MLNLKSIIPALALLGLTACVPQGPVNSKKTTSSSQSNTPSSGTATYTVVDNGNPPITNQTVDTGSGTGSGTGTGTGSGSGTTTPDPVVTEYKDTCGSLYRSKNGVYILIASEDGKYYTITSETTNATSVLNLLAFPNDSYQACISSVVTATTTTVSKVRGLASYQFLIKSIKASYVQLGEAQAHPERTTLNDQYGYEMCGEIKYYTDTGKTVHHIQMRYKNIDYILEDESSTLVSYLDAHGKTKGCVYNNSNYYTDFSRNFKRFFKVAATNIGWP